ncbi:MAG: DNA repair and recombination protein RadA [Nanoarchaeota archaeon]|nr:DNA repair and recombination protein RadA [Nanoarchaeota archaeon]MBU4124354.1 DNA repair and recombination protein RadA [Nanoarchaeota archaeon]
MVKKKEIEKTLEEEIVVEPITTEKIFEGPIIPGIKSKMAISDLPGVGEKIAEKIKEAGFFDMMSIAAASPKELSNAAEIGDATAVKIINAAREELDIGYETADKVMERRKKVLRITTGSKNLDALLGGGVETGATTEFHGGFGSSKTQIAHQLAVNVQLPPEKGGLGGRALFIDTEATFRPERIVQMAKAAGLDPEVALSNVVVGRAYNSDHQFILAEKAGDLIRNHNVKLVIVDSVTAQFRTDFVGRGTLAERQQKLNRHLHTLQRLADVYNVVIYMTNQVMSRPDVMFGDPTAPIGGHIMGHFSTYRIYVRRSKGGIRIAKLIDSPNLPEGEAVFLITGDGLSDPPEKKK